MAAMNACRKCQNPDYCRTQNYCGFHVTSAEFATVKRALSIFERSMGSYAFQLWARPHRKSCIIDHLMLDHSGMTVERAQAIADEMVL